MLAAYWRDLLATINLLRLGDGGSTRSDTQRQIFKLLKLTAVIPRSFRPLDGPTPSSCPDAPRTRPLCIALNNRMLPGPFANIHVQRFPSRAAPIEDG